MKQHWNVIFTDFSSSTLSFSSSSPFHFARKLVHVRIEHESEENEIDRMFLAQWRNETSLPKKKKKKKKKRISSFGQICGWILAKLDTYVYIVTGDVKIHFVNVSSDKNLNFKKTRDANRITRLINREILFQFSNNE